MRSLRGTVAAARLKGPSRNTAGVGFSGHLVKRLPPNMPFNRACKGSWRVTERRRLTLLLALKTGTAQSRPFSEIEMARRNQVRRSLHRPNITRNYLVIPRIHAG